jgi:hypothetical protein
MIDGYKLEEVLQYRQKEADWGGMNEDPEMVWTEWQDVPCVGIVEEG